MYVNILLFKWETISQFSNYIKFSLILIPLNRTVALPIVKSGITDSNCTDKIVFQQSNWGSVIVQNRCNGFMVEQVWPQISVIYPVV